MFVCLFVLDEDTDIYKGRAAYFSESSPEGQHQDPELFVPPYLLTDIKIINWIINNLTHLGHNHRPRAVIIFLGNGNSALH